MLSNLDVSDRTKPRGAISKRNAWVWPLARVIGLACALSSLAVTKRAAAIGEDQYLAGDWVAEQQDNPAVRRGSCVFKATKQVKPYDLVQCYGFGNEERQYLVGDWDGNGTDNLAVRRESCVFMDTNVDGLGDITQCYGMGRSEDQYLVGDWDGDGRDNLAVRRGNCVFMDTNFDAAGDIVQCYGFGNTEDEYLVGDWDGDGRDNLAVRRNHCVFMDTNFDGLGDLTQCYGFGNSEEQYLVGDWDGDGRDNLAVRRGNCVLEDTNFDTVHDITRCYGNGPPSNASLPSSAPLPQCAFSLVGSWLPLQMQSSGFIDVFSRVHGNNDMPSPATIGVQDDVGDGFVLNLEDDGTIAKTQAKIVIRNTTGSTKSAVGIACGQAIPPTTLDVAPGGVGEMTISTTTASTLKLRRWLCDFFCFSRSPQDVALFTEDKFWSALGGKKLTIDWFMD
jgi:hypothetical protein